MKKSKNIKLTNHHIINNCLLTRANNKTNKNIFLQQIKIHQYFGPIPD